MINKTSDKNVANIEEDVKILKEFAEICKAGLACYDQTREGEALENILAEREQMIAEKKKYAIQLTDEQYRKVIENAQMDTSNDTVVAHRFVVMQQQINEKDKQIEELEAKLEFKEYGDLDNVEFEEYMSQFIPKQLVTDKIEEINNNKPYLMKFNDWREKEYTNEDIIDNCVQVLQELLEGERK